MIDESQRQDRLSIVHVTTFYPPHNFGGDGVHVQRLARALARRGHDVSVVYSPAAFSLLQPRGAAPAGVSDSHGGEPSPVTVHALDGWRGVEPLLVQQTGGPVLSRRQLERLIGGEAGPDVIHYHNVSLAGGLGVLGIGDATKLYTTHEYWLTCPTHLLFRYNREICRQRTCIRCTLRSGRPPQMWRTARRRDRALRQIDAIVFPSRLTESVYREQGIEAPGRVLPHFLPDNYIDDAGAAGRRAGDAEPYFLYVGRLDAVKGIESLARYFDRQRPPAPLRIVGGGPLEADLRHELGGSPSVRFLGTLSREDLGPLYRDALALILPSEGYEVFGQVVIEAFSYATPAIVTEVGGAGELIDASGAGYVYGSDTELEAALQAIASDRGHRQRLGEAGLQYVQREHRESDYVDRYEQLIRELRGP